MKVKELYKVLKNMPPDAEVLVSSPEFEVDVDTTECYCEYSEKVVIKVESIFKYVNESEEEEND